MQKKTIAILIALFCSAFSVHSEEPALPDAADFSLTLQKPEVDYLTRGIPLTFTVHYNARPLFRIIPMKIGIESEKNIRNHI